MSQSDKRGEEAIMSMPPVGGYLCEQTDTFATYWKRGAWNEPNREDALTCMEQAVNGWKNLAYDLAKQAHYYLMSQPRYAESHELAPSAGFVQSMTGDCPTCGHDANEAAVSSIAASERYALMWRGSRYHIYLKNFAVKIATFSESLSKDEAERIVAGANGVAVSAIAPKYLVSSGGECPQDWLCNDIPEVQAALCEALYGRAEDADADEIDKYLAQVQTMTPSQRDLSYTFEDGWLRIIRFHRADGGDKTNG